MQATAETTSAAAVTADQPAGGLLRCHVNRLADSPRTNARVSDDVAAQGARRLGSLAILTAASVVVTAIVKNLLQPELSLAYATPLFRLDALFLVLASAGLAALQRSGRV